VTVRLGNTRGKRGDKIGQTHRTKGMVSQNLLAKQAKKRLRRDREMRSGESTRSRTCYCQICWSWQSAQKFNMFSNPQRNRSILTRQGKSRQLYHAVLAIGPWPIMKERPSKIPATKVQRHVSLSYLTASHCQLTPNSPLDLFPTA
jgi:hypothetical protein